MIIAVYSAKGGVGKTTLAVNLAWASATISRRRTLLWDLDPEGGATYILNREPKGKKAQESITGEDNLAKLIQQTATTNLHILPADRSLRNLERSFQDLGKRKRLAKVAGKMQPDYDRIFIDCPPGLTDTADQILRAANLVVVPVVPGALPTRALEHIQAHIAGKGGPRVALVPVFSMVDRRRVLHRDALNRQPSWPVVPMASAYEQMATRRLPIGSFLARTDQPVKAIADLWRKIEGDLTRASKKCGGEIMIGSES